MIQEANCILYTLQERAERQLRLRREAIDAEDKNDLSRLNMLRSEEDLLADETRVEMKSLMRMHDFIQETLTMVNTSKVENALVVQGDTKQVEVVIESMSKFSHWHDIVAMSEILPTDRRVVPDQAFRRMQDKVLGCLAKNGVEPFLLTLPEESRKSAVLQFADILEKAVPQESQRDQVLEGEIKLPSSPLLHDGLQRLLNSAGASKQNRNSNYHPALPLN